jgi:hypothetical protein
MRPSATSERMRRLGLLGPLCLALPIGAYVSAATGVAAQAAAPQSGAGADVAGTPEYLHAIQQAVGHYSARRWHEAQRAFEQAHALQPSARTFRGLGLSAYYLGQQVAARLAFEQALADTRRPLSAEQRAELETLLRATTSETGRFELKVTPDTAGVAVDGASAPGRVLVLARGQHVLALEAEGHEPKRLMLLVSGGEDRLLELTLEAKPSQPIVAATPPSARPEPEAAPAPVAVAAPSPAPVAAPAATDASAGTVRVLAWIAAAAVPVFAGTAAAVWLTGKAKHDSVEQQCQREGCDEPEAARRLEAEGVPAHETWTNVSLAASGVALAASVLLFVLDADEDPSGEVHAGVQLRGARLHGRF